MLSRVRDSRVFTGSEDVVISAHSSRDARRRLLARNDDAIAATGDANANVASDGGSSSEAESFAWRDSRHPPSDQLHPQHPYNAQLLSARASASATTGRTATTSESHPMQLVFLPTGEIRPRDECPPGLALPPPSLDAHSHSQSHRSHRMLAGDDDTFVESTRARHRPTRQADSAHHSMRRGRSERPQSLDASAYPPAVSTRRKSESASDSESDGNGENTTDGKENAPRQRPLELEMPQDREPVGKPLSNNTGRVPTASRSREKPPPLASSSSRSSSSSSDTSNAPQAEWFRRPKAAAYGSTPTAPAPEATTRPLKKPARAKLNVRDLLSADAPRVPSPPSRTALAALEQALGREKTRVLNKMTQLLAEQEKSQQLQRRLDALEATQRDADATAQHAERACQIKVDALVAQLHAQEAAVARLTAENEQLQRSAAAKRKSERATARATSAPPPPQERANVAQPLDAVVAKLRKFHARVQRWKASSTEATDACATDADTVALLESLWRDFPTFPFRELLDERELESGADTSESANVLSFLKQRLRARDDELRRTHLKYVELKELCARQCVREADLQNFINEHRLRGNLVIRRAETQSAAAVDGDGDRDTRKNVQFQAAHARPDGRKRVALTKRPLRYDDGHRAESDEDDDEDDDEEEEEEGDDEEGRRYEDDGDSDDDDDDSRAEYQQQQDVYLRQPKVVVHVGRDAVDTHPSRSAVLRKLDEQQQEQQTMPARRATERIRLVPSPTLARRFERVPPSIASDDRVARRKPSAPPSTPTRSTSRQLLRAPPSISATRSASVAARRKPAPTPAPASRAKIPSMATRGSRCRSSAPWV